jgi:hypothetical protein
MTNSARLPITLYQLVIPIVFIGGFVVLVICLDKHAPKLYHPSDFSNILRRITFAISKFLTRNTLIILYQLFTAMPFVNNLIGY